MRQVLTDIRPVLRLRNSHYGQRLNDLIDRPLSLIKERDDGKPNRRGKRLENGGLGIEEPYGTLIM